MSTSNPQALSIQHEGIALDLRSPQDTHASFVATIEALAQHWKEGQEKQKEQRTAMLLWQGQRAAVVDFDEWSRELQEIFDFETWKQQTSAQWSDWLESLRLATSTLDIFRIDFVSNSNFLLLADQIH
jgi:hypothetical protein